MSVRTVTIDATTKGKQQIEVEGGEEVIITPLGSGGEVGRSCVLVKYQGRTIMFDCGIHPVKSGLDALPLFDSAPLHEVDTCLVTHFHLDHCGGLPYLCEQTGFRGRVIMTHPTKNFYKMVMNDFMRIGSGASDIVNTEWLHSTYDRIETIEYHQEFTHNGVRVVALNAGHVLGAAMFLIDMGGVRILYTGDYSRVPDRHLLGAELPPVSPDILIVESTYGIQVHETREERERKFTSWVHDIVKRGGRCLIPVFALGRAQELLLVLEEYWAENRDIQHVPIFYASSLASRCMNLYRTYGSAMNERVRTQLDNHQNPFDFRFIRSLKDLASFDDNGPSVVLASPGMLQSGVSLELFERWAGDRLNGLIFAGYCADGTLAKQVMRRPKEVQRADGSVLPVRMQDINTVSFSAHSDAKQTCDFIAHLKDTKHVVLVHGNEDSGNKLQKKLTDDFTQRGLVAYTTKNATPVVIPFAVQRTATLIGETAGCGAQLRDQAVASGERAGFDVGLSHSSSAVEGVLLVGADQRSSVVAPKELSEFSGLSLSAVRHASIVPLTTFIPAKDILRQLKSHFAASILSVGSLSPNWEGTKKSRNERAHDATSDDEDGDEAVDDARIAVGATVRVRVRQSATSRTTVIVSWAASAYADLVADLTVVAVMNYAERAAGTSRASSHSLGSSLTLASADQAFRLKCLQRILREHYPITRVNLATGDILICAPTPDTSVWIHVRHWVQCTVLPTGHYPESDPAQTDAESLPALDDSDAVPEATKRHLGAVLRRAFFALHPIPTDEPTGNADEDTVAAYLDRGGWCGCDEHTSHA